MNAESTKASKKSQAIGKSDCHSPKRVEDGQEFRRQVPKISEGVTESTTVHPVILASFELPAPVDEAPVVVPAVTSAPTSAACLRSPSPAEISSKLSEPESVEAKSVELCEGGSSGSLCRTSFSSATSSQATAVVEEVETPSCSLMLSVWTDQGVGEFVAQPHPEVHVPAGCEVKTCGTVRVNAGDRSIDVSVQSQLKDSREVKSNGDNSIVMKFNAWLIDVLLVDHLRCMLFLIVAFVRSLKEYLSTSPLLHRLRFHRGCKLFSVMGFTATSDNS